MHASPQSGPIKFMTWNICRGFNIKEDDDFNWNLRVDSILATIQQEQPGIMTFQECRIWDREDQEMADFVCVLSKMGYHCVQFEPNGGDAGGLVLMTCFRRGKFLFKSAETLWLSDAADLTIPSSQGRINQWGKIMGRVTLIPNPKKETLPQGASIDIFNVHLSLHPSDKEADIKLIIEKVTTCPSSNAIVAGDWNLFPDAESTASNLKLLADSALVDVQERNRRRGTWLGQPLDHPIVAGEVGAELDKVLFIGCKMQQLGASRVIVPTPEEQRCLPGGAICAFNNWASDHAPIVVEFDSDPFVGRQ